MRLNLLQCGWYYCLLLLVLSLRHCVRGQDSSNNSQAATTGFPSTNSLPLDTTATGDLGSMDPSTSSQAQTTPNSNPNNTTDITTTTVSQLESTSTSSTTSNDGTSTIAKSNDEGGSNNGLPAAIAGLVVGLLLLIILSAMIAVNVLFCVRRRGHSRTMSGDVPEDLDSEDVNDELVMQNINTIETVI